jgi:hypothetical protein
MGGDFHLDGKATIPTARAPTLSQHASVWLSRLGYDENQIAAMRANGTV